MQRILLVIGISLVVLGLLWPWLQKTGLGRLPGDIVVERESFRLYLPITSSILVSLVLSLLFWLFTKK